MKNAFLHVYYNLKHYGTSILTQLISDLYAARTGSLLWSENIVETFLYPAAISLQSASGN